MRCLVIFLLLMFVTSCDSTNDVINDSSLPVPQFAVASAHPLATQAGIEILEQGGNAFDAAVAVSSSLAVVEPYASGLGGGGFWLLHIAANNSNIMIDAREKAPFASTDDMYLDHDGNATDQSINGPLAAGIPGVPAAIVHLSENYGLLPLKKTLSKAINIARNGFPISERYEKLAKVVFERLKAFPHASEIFLDNGAVPKPGFILKQPDLANVLSRISDQGMEGFYSGDIANRLVQGVQQAGGIWQLHDLDQYQVLEREPIIGQYKDISVVSAALPSSGGIVLMQMLNMLSMFDLKELDENERIHLIVEIMRRAYFDRARFLGDEDFYTVPKDNLLGIKYAEDLISNFSAEHATASRDYLNNVDQSANIEVQQGKNTTHFSIVDRMGNYVAATLSINYPFGSGFVPKGTGVLLNNEMDDFSIKAGHPNLWGLIGSEANAIEPGKRMLSSMTPTFLSNGERVAVLGTPGGSRIITMVLLSTLAFEDGEDVKTMVEAPRFHHQFLPDEIQFELEGLSEETQVSLKNKGHVLNRLNHKYGNMHAIVWNKKRNTVMAASDPRGIGHAYVSN